MVRSWREKIEVFSESLTDMRKNWLGSLKVLCSNSLSSHLWLLPFLYQLDLNVVNIRP
jgi:hypothetical protein